MADEELGKLVIKLRLDLAEMKKSVEEGQEATKGLADGIKSSWTELNAKKEVLTSVFEAIQGAMDETVGKTVEYAAQVREMMREVGASAGDASKLIQAADDVNVSFETLQQGMRMAIKNGISPTMEGMAALANQYVAIQDPVERTRFLFENFGKAGAELGPLMELGAKGIYEAGKAAEEAGLVMDEKAVAAARRYEIVMDDLGDKMDAYKIRIGNGVIPIINDWAEITNRANQKTEESGTGWMRFIPILNGVHDAWVSVTSAIELNNDKMVENDPAVEDEGDGAERLRDLYQQEADAVDGASSSHENLKLSLDTVMGSIKDVTAEMLFQKAAANMDADSALALGRAMGVVNDRSYAALSGLEELKKKYDENADGAIDAKEAAAGYTDQVALLAQAFGMVESKDVNLGITVQGLDKLQKAVDYWAKIFGDDPPDLSPIDPGDPGGYHNGADFVVPPGYPNDSFGPMYAESGERVTIAPASETAMTSQAMLSALTNIEHALTGLYSGGPQVVINSGGSSPVDLEFLAYQVAEVINRRRR